MTTNNGLAFDQANLRAELNQLIEFLEAPGTRSVDELRSVRDAAKHVGEIASEAEHEIETLLTARSTRDLIAQLLNEPLELLPDQTLCEMELLAGNFVHEMECARVRNRNARLPWEDVESKD